MIKIYCGNVGSGKTASAVREMYKSQGDRVTYTNIVTTIKKTILINQSMIVKKEFKTVKKTKEGLKQIYSYTLNKNFWKENKEAKNIILDEAHELINARSFMTKKSKIVTSWIALIRRCLGHDDAGEGTITFITQLPMRLDVIIRDMATEIRYHICYYNKMCLMCGCTWSENSDYMEHKNRCPFCNKSKIKKYNHIIRVYRFEDIQKFNNWKLFNMKTYTKPILQINDIEKYFSLYDTYQWDNLFEDELT